MSAVEGAVWMSYDAASTINILNKKKKKIKPKIQWDIDKTFVAIAGEQLANFSVSVSDTKPASLTYRPAKKDVCYSQKEAVAPGSATAIKCKPAKLGRFVVVARDDAGVLSLCEVLVY
jgi:hypothetical protein